MSGANKGSARLFSAAVILARRGRYVEATKLLQKAHGAGECSDAEALDLQARIYAQQGLYLHAESCWNKAKQLDGSTPAYDEALSRLRRARHSSGRFVRVSVIISVLLILGLLFWQVAFVNPTIVARQDAAESSLSAIRGEIAALQDASRGRDQALATTVTSLGTGLTDFESRLSERLELVPTVSRTAEDRNAVIARVDAQIGVLQKALEREAGSLETRRAEADIAQVKRIETLEAAIADMGKVLASLEEGLSKRVEAAEIRLAERVDAMDDTVKREMKSLPTSAKLATLGDSISKLHEQLAEIAAAVKPPKGASDQNVGGADDDKRTDQPSPPPEGQRP